MTGELDVQAMRSPSSIELPEETFKALQSFAATYQIEVRRGLDALRVRYPRIEHSGR